MRTTPLALFAVCLLSVAACDKLRGKSSDDDGGAASASGPLGIASKAFSLLSPAGAPFEGEITMSSTHSGKPTPEIQIYEAKGDKLRFDDPAKHSYMIMNAADKKIIEVDDAKKTAMVIDLDQMQKMADQMTHGPHAPPGTGVDDEDTTIDMSGGTDVVAGYSCDKWKVTETNKVTHKVRKTDTCLAKGIGFPDMSMGHSSAKSWTSKLVADKFFPLRLTTTEDGVETMHMEVTKVDKKTLAATRFEVPAGYTVTDMAEMMKGLQGMQGKPPH